MHFERIEQISFGDVELKRFMKKILGFSGLILLLCSFSHFGKLKSDLRIPAHQQFYLGGGQPTAFHANAENIGQVPVTLLLQLKNSETRDLITLKPGEKTKTKVPRGAALLFTNNSNQDARLKVVAKGSPQSLAMYYENESGNQSN
jgi:hypothetical protein